MVQITVSGLLILNFSVVTELKNLSVGDYLMNVKIIGEKESKIDGVWIDKATVELYSFVFSYLAWVL